MQPKVSASSWIERTERLASSNPESETAVGRSGPSNDSCSWTLFVLPAAGPRSADQGTTTSAVGRKLRSKRSRNSARSTAEEGVAALRST